MYFRIRVRNTGLNGEIVWKPLVETDRSSLSIDVLWMRLPASHLLIEANSDTNLDREIGLV